MNMSSRESGNQVGTRGSITEQQLRLQQQNFLRASAGQQAMGGDALEAARRMLMGAQAQQASQQHQHSSNGSFPGLQQNTQGQARNQGETSGSMINQQLQQHQQRSTLGASGVGDASMNAYQSGSHAAPAVQDNAAKQDQQSFLDGNFAGGWQSNADLPDRRRIIFHILDVIRVMRPDNSKMSNK